MVDNEVFIYNGGKVELGEIQDIWYGIFEMYFGDLVCIFVIIINGELLGLIVFFFVVVYGDELNGIEVVCEVVYEWDFVDFVGMFVCMLVMNVLVFFV